MAGLLALIGSGETAPSMARTHRAVLARLDRPASCAVIDTPYGFQENADEITSRLLGYFHDRLGLVSVVASLRRAGEDPVGDAVALARIREAPLVFSGPGSPSYALRQWRRTPLPQLLAEKLRDRSAIVLASAAAVTAGVVAAPIYEIYKVGADPVWLAGLDLLSVAGLRAAVLPHFDNAEGGTHDTRFCYLGERRLADLERILPDGAFVLGIDEHTALLLDLAEATATVLGRGGVTVRRAGRSTVFPAGRVMPLSELRAAGSGAAGPQTDTSSPAQELTASLLPGLDDMERQVEEGLANHDPRRLLGGLLRVEELSAEEATSGRPAAQNDPSRARLRALLVRVGEAAAAGTPDERAVLAPVVEALLAKRDELRARRDWAAADAIRDALVEGGVEVRDVGSSSEWGTAAGPRAPGT